MNMKPGILLVGFVMVAGLAGAAEITINSSTTGTVGWNSAIWGDPAAVPTSGNDYVHDNSTTAILLGMGTQGSFAGDKLTLDAGTKLVNKGGGGLGGHLYLNGGQWETRSPGTSTMLGVIRVTAASTVLLIDGNMQWNTGLSSTAGAVLTVQNWSQAGRSMVFNATDQGFLGTFSIKDSGLNPNTWTIQFDKSYTNATLKIEGQKNDAAYAAVYQLTNNIVFNDVFMPNGSGGSVDLDPGTYDAAALVAAGVSSNYFNDLGGTIIVLEGESVITINPATTGNVGWNTAIWGDPAAVPVSGNEYVHDDSTAAILLGMGAEGSFAGDRLTLDTGTTLVNQGGGGLGGHLYLNGGQWQTRSPGTSTMLGVIRVTAASTILLIDGNMQWNTGLSSTADAVLTVQNWSQAGRSMVVNATDQGFLGTFSITDSGLNPNTWTIQFDKSYTNATLKIEGQKNDAAYAAVYQLTNTIQFAAVQMPNGSGGLVTLDPGTYDAVALAAAGVSGDYYNDLGGTIQVGAAVASGYDTWAGEWGVDIGSETNDYDNDLFNNFYEYVMNGDPTNSAVYGEDLILASDGSGMTVVHAQRSDDTNLVYYLKTSLDLVSGSWTNAGYSVSGTNVTGGTFDYVTNTIPMGKDQTFIRLMIEE